jgi:uncharacterized protein with HEPN domain
MQLIELKDLLRDYPLNSFVGTPKAVSIDQEQLSLDMEKAFSVSAKAYLYSLSDLANHNAEFFSDNVIDFGNYLSRLIGTTCALREIIQIGEDMTNIFENELNWARGLAIRSMITILDSIIQELTIIRQQVKSSRIINRIRDKISFIISQKIPQIFYILSTIIAIELKQISPSEIVSAIGKGMKLSQTC